MNEEKYDRLTNALVHLWPKKRGLNAEICRKTGYSPGHVSGVINGKVPLDERFIKIVCREFSINEQWIDTGEGSKFITQQDIPANPNSENKMTLVPVWDSVPAGWPAEKGIVCEEPIDYIPVNGSGKNMGALLVEGHSMSPEIREGEYVLYTQDYDIKPGDWIVAMDEFNRPMIKEYALKSGESWLVSINPEYPSFKVNSNYRIIGKVIDIYSRRKAKRRAG